MKERVLDVLMYLFDHCIDEDQDAYSSDQDSLVRELEAVGFGTKEIDRAFDWLEGIHGLHVSANAGEIIKGPGPGECFRVYTPEEVDKLSAECIGLLLSLEQMRVVDMLTREVIIDRAMALDLDEIRLDHFRWITLMVLINRGNEQSLEWLEEVIFSEDTAPLH